MQRQQIESPQNAFSPAVTVVELTDPTTVGEDIEVLRQELVKLETRPMRARQIYVRLDDSLVLYQSTNVRLRVRVTSHDRLLTYSVYGPQAGGTLNGMPIVPNLFLAAAPGSQAELVVKAGFESVDILFPSYVLTEHLLIRQREENGLVPQGLKLLHTNEVNARRLFDWGKRLADTAAQHPELFNDRKETLVAVQTELLEMLLAALDTTMPPLHTRNHQLLQARNSIVRLAEEYALAHIDDRLYVTDLCRAVGVSERTLQYAFQEVLGMSPLAYLTRLRLHRVRKALRMGTYGSTTVSAEALRWGFWHFGDFSRAYKDCFGELPSESLRRKPAETSVRRS